MHHARRTFSEGRWLRCAARPWVSPAREIASAELLSPNATPIGATILDIMLRQPSDLNIPTGSLAFAAFIWLLATTGTSCSPQFLRLIGLERPLTRLHNPPSTRTSNLNKMSD